MTFTGTLHDEHLPIKRLCFVHICRIYICFWLKNKKIKKSKKGLTSVLSRGIINLALNKSAKQMREWWNWQTR